MSIIWPRGALDVYQLVFQLLMNGRMDIRFKETYNNKNWPDLWISNKYYYNVTLLYHHEMLFVWNPGAYKTYMR